MLRTPSQQARQEVADECCLMQVPPAWLKAYPSLKALGPWTRDLLQRLDQLRRWIDKGYPICYCLAAFTYPTAFLTAVLQVCFHSSLNPSWAFLLNY